MPDLKNNVGEGEPKDSGDVGLVQVMLLVIKTPKGSAYLHGKYDGLFGPATKDAIVRFQKDHGLAGSGASAAETLGHVAKQGATLKKLNELLPATHRHLLVLEGTSLVYLAGSETAMRRSIAEITGNVDLDLKFREALVKIVNKMYADHKIVLSIPRKDGARRDFKSQFAIHQNDKGSHPGESNHQYGKAADLGMQGLRWIAPDGSIAEADFWLQAVGKSEKMSGHHRAQLWKARNAIALGKTGRLFPASKAGDYVHVQAYNDAIVDYPASLAKLLNAAGKLKWSGETFNKRHRYKTDFGLGGPLYPVGSASDIWGGKAQVTPADLVAAIKGSTKDMSTLPGFKDFTWVKKAAGTNGAKPLHRGAIAAADVQPADIALIQQLLRKDWEAAEAKWRHWTPVNKSAHAQSQLLAH